MAKCNGVNDYLNKFRLTCIGINAIPLGTFGIYNQLKSLSELLQIFVNFITLCRGTPCNMFFFASMRIYGRPNESKVMDN